MVYSRIISMFLYFVSGYFLAYLKAAACSVLHVNKFSAANYIAYSRMGYGSAVRC